MVKLKTFMSFVKANHVSKSRNHRIFINSQNTHQSIQISPVDLVGPPLISAATQKRSN